MIPEAFIIVTKNKVTGRLHPFLWVHNPAPSEDGHGSRRFKTKLHHTAGFTDLVEARAQAAEMKEQFEEAWGPILVIDDVADDSWETEVPAGVMWVASPPAEVVNEA